MLLRKGFPDMPTSTVVLDLISRTGSPTRYSLSPYQGMRKLAISKGGNNNKYEAMVQSPVIGELIKQQDDFTFYHNDFIYTCYQRDCDLVEMEELDEDVFRDRYPEVVHREEITPYAITDKGAPDYVRRFEDRIPAKNMETFIRHVLSNALTNDKGFRRYEREHPVGQLRKRFDGDDEVEEIENEWQEEGGDTEQISDSLRLSARRDLAYCLYRMNQMSRKCGVNVLSVVLAQRRARPYLTKSTRVEKPQTLIREGPVYYADMNGDCTGVITDATDRALAKARSVFYADGGQGVWLEFVEDYRKLDRCLSILEIDARSEDPRRYTSTFIKKISRKIMVDNFTYVARANGGYNKEILNSLRKLSLDTVQNTSIEKEFNPVSIALSIIMDYELTPSNIWVDFTRNPPKRNLGFCCETLPLLMQPEECQLISSPIGEGGELSPDGFVLDCTGDYYRMRCSKMINKSKWGVNLTGNFYIHHKGYVVFEPINDKLLILSRLSDVISVLNTHDWTNLPVIPLGENASQVK